MQTDTRYVIVADGAFPSHPIPLKYLHEAEFIVCCDGASEGVVKAGFEPSVIVGDCDSLPLWLEERYSDRIVRDTGQESNDLTKAVNWCVTRGAEEIIIVGATGKREDHTLGNISLLAEYCQRVTVRMITDHGTFIPLTEPAVLPVHPGQTVSIFGIGHNMKVTAEGTAFPVRDLPLESWWTASLNHATGNILKIKMNHGTVIIFLSH